MAVQGGCGGANRRAIEITRKQQHVMGSARLPHVRRVLGDFGVGRVTSF
jgi:hypothetical protein